MKSEEFLNISIKVNEISRIFYDNLLTNDEIDKKIREISQSCK